MAMLLALGACTVIRVGEGSDVKVRYLPGVAVVKVDPSDRIEVVSMRGLGVRVDRDALSLGWASTDIALVPPGACSMVLWKPTGEAVRAADELLAGDQACIVKGGNE